LPAKDAQRDGDALIDERKRAPAPELPRQKVLTQAKADVRVASAAPKAEQTELEVPARGLDLLDSAAAIARMEAVISRKLDEYAKRPRKKFIGARAQEYRFAQYLEDWRQKIERVGTLNYPDAARGRVYGSLLLFVAIKSDGSILKAEIQRSSGEKVLDDAALRIVNMSAPFAPFPDDIRRDFEIIEFGRTWTFTNTDKVTAN
jgi:protein TonB